MRASPAHTGPGHPGPVLRDLVELIYELLDAHADTQELADGLEPAVRWEAHLDYLRALQRTGRSLLARACSEEPT